MVTVLADTLSGEELTDAPGQQVMMEVRGRNVFPLNTIYIPIEFGGDVDLTFDSVSIVGCRTENFDAVEYLHYDPFNDRMYIKISADVWYHALGPGEGTILKVYFTINSSAEEDLTTTIQFDGYLTLLPTFTGEISYEPYIINGAITTGGCCVGIRGNIDGDQDDELNIADLVYFAGYSFGGQTPPPCFEEADVDASGELDIVDIVYLVNYMFNDGPPPLPC